MISKVPSDYFKRIKQLRQRFGITQTQLAELLGVSFASINRWETKQSKPNKLAWNRIERAEVIGLQAFEENNALIKNRHNPVYPVSTRPALDLDFTAPPETILTVVEAYRLAFGYQNNPAFATETSLIDPLPHQQIGRASCRERV